MVRPITLISRPGATARMARFSDSCGALDEQAGFLVDVADQEGVVGVAVHAADERGDVDVEDVAVLDDRGVRDAVADHFIQRGAQRFGEAAVAERGRVRLVVQQELVAYPVQLVGGDAGLDVFSDFHDGLGRDP